MRTENEILSDLIQQAIIGGIGIVAAGFIVYHAYHFFSTPLNLLSKLF